LDCCSSQTLHILCALLTLPNHIGTLESADTQTAAHATRVAPCPASSALSLFLPYVTPYPLQGTVATDSWLVVAQSCRHTHTHTHTGTHTHVHVSTLIYKTPQTRLYDVQVALDSAAPRSRPHRTALPHSCCSVPCSICPRSAYTPPPHTAVRPAGTSSRPPQHRSFGACMRVCICACVYVRFALCVRGQVHPCLRTRVRVMCGQACMCTCRACVLCE